MNGRQLFRIFYTAFFTVLIILLLGLLLITPADAIRQALKNGQLYNVFVIAGCYLLTVLLTILIYASRLYTNRSVLSAIPKTWIPVEKGDVNKRVRKMIASSLSRSARIAWDSRPRIASQPTAIVSEPDTRDAVAAIIEFENPEKGKGRERIFYRRLRRLRTQTEKGIKNEKEEHTVTIPIPQPVWGEIAHSGWSSPASPDLPDLQYTNVILELPHLIEARAVSMAPPDPDSTSDPPMPDLRAVDLLQRPSAMGLRDYTVHLTSVGIFKSPSTVTEFLAAYEFARFSLQPLSELEFRDLMKQFAEVLRSMQPLSPAILESLDTEFLESDIDDDASSTSTPRSRSLVSAHTTSSRSGSEGTIHTRSSQRIGLQSSSPAQGHPKFGTAPATPKGRKSRKNIVSRSRSMNSFAQSRNPYNGSSAGSSTSLKSSGQGSVIKLSTTNEDGDLPYTIEIPRVR